MSDHPETTEIDEELEELLVEFRAEAEDGLAEVDELLLAASPDSVPGLFRVFHSLKGVAGMLGFDAAQAVCHTTETELARVRDGEAKLEGELLDGVFDATSTLRQMLAAGAMALVTGELPDLETQDAPARPDAIRVDAERVDTLVDLIGELVVVEAMVSGGAGEEALARLSKLTRELQRTGMALRMVPVRSLFRRMARLVRDLGASTGKPVVLETSGEHAELDRGVVERLADPLLHMVRNAVDHGIEDDRAGKAPTGTLTLSARSQPGCVVVELSDDGKGIDPVAIRDKAIQKGIINENNVLTDTQCLELVFAPGFSTAAAVTDLSGRGVGMDVVKQAVEDLRGHIRIESTLGAGTRFRMVLPLTLSIVDGLLLRSGSDRYVLPCPTVRETIGLGTHAIRRFADGGPMLDLRGELIPMLRLDGVLGRPAGDPRLAVVVDALEGPVAIEVEEVLGQQQVVVKPLVDPLADARLFSGAAVLGDGRVGLILNADALVGAAA